MNFNEHIKREPNIPLAKRLNIGVYVISAAVLLLVALMREIQLELPAGWSLSFLPGVHAGLNTAVTILLIASLVFIKRGSVSGHKFCINAAMTCSATFLLCYVAYHLTSEATKFGGEGAIWYVYIALLVSHIILAAISFPFILYTWVLGFTNQFSRHRKFAKFVFPVWLYVAVTGPVCYLMLRPYYGT
jgi:putative membrane protein